MIKENVHLLVIEDNPRFLKELLEWLKDEFGYPEVSAATSVVEAKEKLKNPYDIVIADMRMERDDSGFAILDHIKDNNLSTVVIILTANDNVTDCRRAFREEAWDYISKNLPGNCFEVLNESIQGAIQYLDCWGSRPNQQWFDENRENLESQHWGQWIAIINKSVIEIADTEAELLHRLEGRRLRRFTTTIHKIGDLRPITDLVQSNEGQYLEFKSTLMWDIDENKKDDKKTPMRCIKAITAFMNADGGTVLIGVRDDRSIYGLERDLGCLKNGNLDKFERHLVDLIKKYIGQQFLPLIKICFEEIQNKWVCGVHVKKSSKKVFLKASDALQESKDLNSALQTALVLYVREGNSSRPVTASSLYGVLYD